MRTRVTGPQAEQPARGGPLVGEREQRVDMGVLVAAERERLVRVWGST
jgi:hypothetical protein